MRLGRVSFTNCLPVFHALETKQIASASEIIAEPPTVLNQMFADNELDITAVSSIAYARMAEDCLILPDISISSDGPVHSVLLLSKVPVDRLDGCSICVTVESATSVALLTILLESYYCLNVKLVPSPGNLEEMLEKAPAALLLGDKALKALHSNSDLYVYDLGHEWKKFTGEKMVFAVWAVRRSTVWSRPHEVRKVWQKLQNSKEYGLTHPWEIAQRGSEITQLSPGVMLDYFRHLSFRLDRDYQRGLACFLFHAFRLGLLNRAVKPEIWREIDAAANCRQNTGGRTADIR